MKATRELLALRRGTHRYVTLESVLPYDGSTVVSQLDSAVFTRRLRGGWVIKSCVAQVKVK